MRHAYTHPTEQEVNRYPSPAWVDASRERVSIACSYREAGSSVHRLSLVATTTEFCEVVLLKKDSTRIVLSFLE